MKQILLNIPDNKYQDFLEILKSLDFVEEYTENDIHISEKEKQLVLDRQKNSDKSAGKSRDDIKDSFILD